MLWKQQLSICTALFHPGHDTSQPGDLLRVEILPGSAHGYFVPEVALSGLFCPPILLFFSMPRYHSFYVSCLPFPCDLQAPLATHTFLLLPLIPSCAEVVMVSLSLPHGGKGSPVFQVGQALSC